MRIRNALDKVGVLRPVLEQRDFRLLWIGTTLSSIGDGFFLVALAWQVYDLEANPAALAAVGIAWTLPQVLLMVPAGVMADRVDRRRLMILGDLTRAVAVGAVAALSLSETVTVALMIALAVLLGVGEAVFTPAQVSIVPSLVPEEHLVQANSLRQFTNPLTYTLLGPFLGGMTIALVGVGWAFAVDAATFLVCAVLVAMIRHRRIKADEPTAVVEDIREGVRFVRQTRWFWVGLVSTSAAILLTVGAWDTLLPFLVKVDLHASAFALGAVFAAGGCGAMVTSFLMGQRGRLPRRPLTRYYLAWILASGVMAAFGIALHVWEVVLIAAVSEAASTVQNVLWFTVQYRLIPEKILGRVSSLDWTISLAGLPLSYAIVGPLARAIGTREALVLTGLAGAVAMALPLLIPGALAPERDGSLGEVEVLDEHES
jgi:MFS family permease